MQMEQFDQFYEYEEFIDTIPDELIESICKKQSYISQLHSQQMHAQNFLPQDSNITDKTDANQFYSLPSENSNLSLNTKHSMKQLIHTNTKQFDQYCYQEKKLILIDEIFAPVISQLTHIKVRLMQLAETSIQTVIENKKQEGDSPQLSKSNNQQKLLALEQFAQYFQTQIQKYIKTMKIRQVQFGSVIYLHEKYQCEETFIKDYQELYGKLGKLIIKCSSKKERKNIDLNFAMLDELIQVEAEMLRDFEELITRIQKNIVDKNYQKDLKSITKIVHQMKIINSKLMTVAECFPSACTLDKNDLFSLKKQHPRWLKLLKNSIKYKFYGESEKIRQSFSSHKNGLNLINATMSIIHQSKSHWGQKKKWGKLAESTAKIIKCAISKNDAAHEAAMLFSDPDGTLTKQIWNLPDHKLLRNFVTNLLPSIQFSEEYWIPRLFEDFIESEAKIGIPDVTIFNSKKYYEQMKQSDDSKIGIRINSPFQLMKRDQLWDQQENKGSIFKSLKSYFKKGAKAPEKIIFHIHGGGFISMTSFIHQSYTRLWSKNLDVPIVSVDYGKAPQRPYPCGLYDCLEAYMWTLYCFRQIYQVQPVQIIMVGDSAGGNLVLALTNLLITFQLRVPDGIVLVYPVLNLNLQQFTPSMVTALNDFILPHTFLKLCGQAYLSETKNLASQDYNISPLITPNNIIKDYPPLRIFVGGRDPFHDDCCRFTEKINDISEGKAKLMVFDEFPHGFLQFDFKTQPHLQCRKAVLQVEKALKEMLN